MIIHVDEEIELKQFKIEYSRLFFEAIQANAIASDNFCKGMKLKYNTLERVESRLKDAITNKFMLDGTPDFFIFYKEKIVGIFEFHPLSDDNHLEIGFWLFPGFRALRIQSRIFPSMIGYAQKYFPKRQLIATTAFNNIAAQKLLSGRGFTKIGNTKEVDPKTGECEEQFICEFRIPQSR